jgi:DNA end-binding protein Ku
MGLLDDNLHTCRRSAPGFSPFGLISIPVELHPATKDEHVAFHLLHAKRIAHQNRFFCPMCNVAVATHDLVRGYEYPKGEYVRFSEAELESLATESSNNIDLKEFVPLSTIDLGAAEGGEKLYRVLADALIKSKRAAIAQLVSRGKEQLVLIRPYKNGLIMRSLYYADEVRDFRQISKGENVKLSHEEVSLGAGLIERMSDDFEPQKYKDEYRIRVVAMLDEKSKGREVTVPPAAPPRHGQLIDLMEALSRAWNGRGRRKPVLRGGERTRPHSPLFRWAPRRWDKVMEVRSVKRKTARFFGWLTTTEFHVTSIRRWIKAASFTWNDFSLARKSEKSPYSWHVPRTGGFKLLNCGRRKPINLGGRLSADAIERKFGRLHKTTVAELKYVFGLCFRYAVRGLD